MWVGDEDGVHQGQVEHVQLGVLEFECSFNKYLSSYLHHWYLIAPVCLHVRRGEREKNMETRERERNRKEEEREREKKKRER